MIGEDRDGVRSSLQVLFPLYKGEDNGEELSIIYVVVVLGQGEGFRKIGTRVEVACFVQLHQDSAGSQKGGVSHEGEGVSNVRDA